MAQIGIAESQFTGKQIYGDFFGEMVLQDVYKRQLLKDGVLQVIYEKETNAPATGDASRPIMVWLLPIVAFMVIQLCRRKRCSSRFIQVDLS